MREIFEFLNKAWDVTKAHEMVDSGTLKPKTVDADIRQWAKEILLLDREHPEKRSFSIWIAINHDHVAALRDDQLTKPAICVDLGDYSIFIDGNHRIARAYLSGRDTYPTYYFSAKQAKKFRI